MTLAGDDIISYVGSVEKDVDRFKESGVCFVERF